MKICIFGNKTSTKALIENLLNKDIKVSCLVTLSDNAKNFIQLLVNQIN